MEKVNNPLCRCLSPKRILNPYTHEMVVVPCGHCKACNLNKANSMSFKCALEMQQHKYTLFITLTYSNRYIPRANFVDSTQVLCGADLFDKETGECLGEVQMSPQKREELLKKFYLFGDVPYLRKSDLQKFLKRFRYYAGKVTKEKVRYFAVGEYGPVHFRPHYHLLLFFDSAELFQVSSEIVYSSWLFGRCDVQLAQGTANSYVASYVNSYSYIPQVFTLPATKPFCVHSQRLGLGFFKDASEEIYAHEPEWFIKRSICVNGKYTDFDLWRSAYSLFFPRCKGYANKSACQRAYTYQLYDSARKVFPAEETTIGLAKATAQVIYLFGINPDTYLNTCDESTQLEYLRYFYDGTVLSYPQDSPEYDKYVYRIYIELLLSKHFLYYVCKSTSSSASRNAEISRKLRMIDAFYKRLDYLRLKDFFESQQLFFDSDFCGDDDLMTASWEESYCPYFYNNVDISMLEYKNSPVYKMYSSYIDERYQRSIKHKELNDKNKIFLD